MSIDAAPPLQRVRNRSPPSILGEWLEAGGYRRGTGNHSPRVEHISDVSDIPRRLGDAKHQVVVLAAVKAFAEATNGADELRRTNVKWLM